MTLAGDAALAPAVEASPARRKAAEARANPLLVLIVTGMVVALGSLGFVAVAPNRILSGKAVPLWSAVEPGFALLVGALVVALGVAALVRSGPWRDRIDRRRRRRAADRLRRRRRPCRQSRGSR